MILTDQHKAPPRLYNTGHGNVASAALIKQGDIQGMARLGLYRHESIGPGPYGDWELTSDAEGPLFTRQTRDLTPEEVDARREQLQALRSEERVRRQTGGFPHAGHIYRSDREESIPLLTAAVINAQSALAAGPEAVAAYEAALGAGWRDVGGVARISTALGILELHTSFVAWGAACDQASQALKAQIEAADLADFDALEAAITDDANWPSA
jgi:hypothetical protein